MSVTITCPLSPLVESAAEILRGANISARLTLDSSLGAEGFRIADADGELVISGADARGLLYGAGKHLRLPAWRGGSVPRRPVRGIYFASHFHNTYHEAPLEQLRDYVRELALWGCNALSVWFDMHHFDSLQAADAQAMLERLRAILRAAKEVGMDTALTTLANEAYRSSPEELRADWRAGQNGYHKEPRGHYEVELCPSKPGGLDLILQYRRELLEAFADIGIDYVWIWPYDQGGCTCADCAPWGGKGLLTVGEPYAALVREIMPEAKIVLSTWYFDHFVDGEWDAFYEAAADGLPWADYVMINPADLPLIRERGAPAGLPVLDFPEISMWGNWPWGGFGAHPCAEHLAEYAATTGDLLAGSFPYSEGIFEDINKVLMLQWAWQPDADAADILREYAAAHVDAAVAEDFVELARGLEADSHGHLVIEREAEAIDAIRSHRHLDPGDAFSHHFRLPEQPRLAAMTALAEAINESLSPEARRSWRWRIVYLRARLDALLRASDGRPTAEIDACFDELNRVYGVEHPEMPVVAPSTRALIDVISRRRQAF